VGGDVVTEFEWAIKEIDTLRKESEKFHKENLILEETVLSTTKAVIALYRELFKIAVRENDGAKIKFLLAEVGKLRANIIDVVHLRQDINKFLMEHKEGANNVE